MQAREWRRFFQIQNDPLGRKLITLTGKFFVVLYHYHGGPNAMYDDAPGPNGSPVIGFAADGFPIYCSYFPDSSTGAVRKAISGYTVKNGSRGTRSDTNPGGEYTGRYNDDWEHTDAGDLDECNGMTVNGQYGYYVTDSYPWVIKCLKGKPHASFVQSGGGPRGAFVEHRHDLGAHSH